MKRRSVSYACAWCGCTPTIGTIYSKHESSVKRYNNWKIELQDDVHDYVNENELLQMELNYARDILNALTTRNDHIEILNATYVRDIINWKQQLTIANKRLERVVDRLDGNVEKLKRGQNNDVKYDVDEEKLTQPRKRCRMNDNVIDRVGGGYSSA